jgi:hypothetical protein
LEGAKKHDETRVTEPPMNERMVFLEAVEIADPHEQGGTRIGPSHRLS